ncbi:MAG: isocitrate lyase/PEP mutase family protein [Hyphomicrobiaceae bacterium]
MARPELKQMLAERSFVGAPGVFDMISTKVADQTDASALYVTGYGLVASHLGLPDAGLATYTDMLDRIVRITASTTKPVIADADTGYGGLLNVHHTIRGYEAAGVSAIQLEDQEFPKKCGHTPGRRVIPVEDMVAKIKVADQARSSPDFLIIARTDARTSLGLEEALRRGEAFAKAGADILFIESPESEDEMAKIGRTFDQPLLANMVHGGSTPILSAQKLKALGYLIAIYPAIGFLAMGEALRRGYDAVISGSDESPVPLYDFMKFSEVMGFKEIWELERQFADLEDQSDKQ